MNGEAALLAFLLDFREWLQEQAREQYPTALTNVQEPQVAREYALS